MRAKQSTLTEQLKRAIESSPKSAHAIASEAEVDPAIVSRFLAGKRTVTLDTASRLAGVLKLGLRPIR